VKPPPISGGGATEKPSGHPPEMQRRWPKPL
jgi:hypothetical protein